MRTPTFGSEFFHPGSQLSRIRIFPSWIPDPNFSILDPGSKFFLFRSRIKELKYFNPKNCFEALGNMIRDVHPGSGSRFFTHSGSRGHKGTGSRIRIRNTAFSSWWQFETKSIKSWISVVRIRDILAVLRIRDVYPGSRILIFTHPGSRISDPGSRIQKQ